MSLILMAVSAVCLVAGSWAIIWALAIHYESSTPQASTRNLGSPRAQAHAFGRMLARDHKAYAYDLADAVNEGIRHELYGNPADKA